MLLRLLIMLLWLRVLLIPPRPSIPPIPTWIPTQATQVIIPRMGASPGAGPTTLIDRITAVGRRLTTGMAGPGASRIMPLPFITPLRATTLLRAPQVLLAGSALGRPAFRLPSARLGMSECLPTFPVRSATPAMLGPRPMGGDST